MFHAGWPPPAQTNNPSHSQHPHAPVTEHSSFLHHVNISVYFCRIVQNYANFSISKAFVTRASRSGFVLCGCWSQNSKRTTPNQTEPSAPGPNVLSNITSWFFRSVRGAQRRERDDSATVAHAQYLRATNQISTTATAHNMQLVCSCCYPVQQQPTHYILCCTACIFSRTFFRFAQRIVAVSVNVNVEANAQHTTVSLCSQLFHCICIFAQPVPPRS